MHRKRPEGFLFQPNYIPFDAGREAGWTRNKISLIHKNSRSVSRLSFCPREIKIPALGGRIIDNVGTRAGFPRSNFSFSFFFFSFTHGVADFKFDFIFINFKNSISVYFTKCKKRKKKEKRKSFVEEDQIERSYERFANFQPERATGSRRSRLGRRSSPSFFLNRFRSSRDKF